MIEIDVDEVIELYNRPHSQQRAHDIVYMKDFISASGFLLPFLSIEIHEKSVLGPN